MFINIMAIVQSIIIIIAVDQMALNFNKWKII